jgi:hypothetical protein
MFGVADILIAYPSAGVFTLAHAWRTRVACPRSGSGEQREQVPAELLKFRSHIMSKLTTEARKKLPKSAFALPGGRYPIEDKAHARDAKARASQGYNSGHLSAAEKAKVDQKADSVLAKKGK